jgi:hypothetical protein
VDAATLDMVADAPLLLGSRADRLIMEGYNGRDPFGAVHLKNSWGHVRHAAKMDLGRMNYIIKRV